MDYYKILGLNKNASQDDIKKSYRTLAMKHHPDRGGDSKTFQEINEAYKILGDPQKRAAYDNPSPRFDGFGPGSENINLSDLFAHVFNQRGFGFNDSFSQNRKPVYRARISISLLEAYNCETKVLKLTTETGQKVVSIDIPRGVQSGSQIRYDNVIEGTTLLIEFLVTPDLKFDRKGNDLYCNIPLSVLDLISGTKVKFVAINGKTLEVDIPPLTQPNSQLKITGHGMPMANGNYGNQILLIKPFIPDSIDRELLDAIRKHKENTQ